MRILFIFILSLFASLSFASDKPSLVLLPIELSNTDSSLEDEFGAAIQQSLKNEYSVFYGAAVEEQLEKEYSKIDCDAERYIQNIAIAFNAELVADASVTQVAEGFFLKLVVNNIATQEVISANSLSCEKCNIFDAMRLAEQIGGANSAPASATASSQGNNHLRKLNNQGQNVPGNALDWQCVEDTRYNLVWENKSPSGLKNANAEMSWRKANVNYVKRANKQALCGAKNWRLPTASELQSLLHKGSYVKIDRAYFPHMRIDGFYWSSDEANSGFSRRALSFSDGLLYSENKAYKGRVILVSSSAE